MNNVIYPIKRISFFNTGNQVIVINNPNGAFLEKKEHESIINKIHEYFDLKDVRYPTPNYYRPIRLLNGRLALELLKEQSEKLVSENVFLKVEDHDRIIGVIEEQIFKVI